MSDDLTSKQAVECALKHADSVAGDSTDALALRRLAEEVRRLAQPPAAPHFDLKRANELGDAIVQRICDSPDHTSPDDDPQLLCAYPFELHTAVVAELENEFERLTGRSCLDGPPATKEAALTPVDDMARMAHWPGYHGEAHETSATRELKDATHLPLCAVNDVQFSGPCDCRGAVSESAPRLAPENCPVSEEEYVRNMLASMADWLITRSGTVWAEEFGHEELMKAWGTFLKRFAETRMPVTEDIN